MIAAEAAECAGLQGEYWPMHDLLFAGQQAWSNNSQALDLFLGYAADLGLDMTAFRSCMSEHQTVQKIQSEQTIALQLGIQGTPNFVLWRQGEARPYLFQGAYPYEAFQQALDTLLGEGEP